MGDRLAIDKLFRARDPAADPSGATIWAHEAESILDELRADDADSGKPRGRFSDLAIDVLSGKAVRVGGRDVQGVLPEECDPDALRLIAAGLDEAKLARWSRDTSRDEVRATVLPTRNGHEVFVTARAGFAVDAEGHPPENVLALGKQLFHAGEWVQSCFGTSHNLFTTAPLDMAGRRAVLDQLTLATDADLSELNVAQQDQLLGNIAGLLAELIKSVDVTSPVPGDRSAERALIHDALWLLLKVLDDGRLSPPIKHQLVGYLAGSDSVNQQLLSSERAELRDRFVRLNPELPFDYDEWDRTGKSNIRVDHVAGLGEGLVYGFSKWLEERGLGDEWWTEGLNTLRLLEGDRIRGPVRLEVTVPSTDPINAWGRDMKVEIDVRSFQNDMLSGLGKPEVDITGYDGHSGFGRNTLDSMASAPAQVGPKLLYRWVCAGVDVENEIARHSPEAYANSYTTQDSGYFRRTAGPPEVGQYAYESEGWEAIRCLIRGVLGKKSHGEIQADMKEHANWWGHTPGNDNNCVGPGDPRRGGSIDWDRDGIPNMYDLMPSVNTFDVEASVGDEFELRVPAMPPWEIRGDRAFQAIQFVNTATNYNSYLKHLNYNRRINASPEGVWFDGLTDPKTYVRFSEGPGGSIGVRMNSALSDMTIESLRAILFFETARDLLARSPNPRLATHADQVAAAVLFAASALAYDSSYRDRPIFEGLAKLYGLPSTIAYWDVARAVSAGEEAHDYTGNLEGVRQIVERYGSDLASPEVGQPAIEVQ